MQFDYARRIAAEIVKLDTTLRQNDREGVKAVGILGSDVYDKLLILQALRSQLPDAYFFTTELDNRLLDPVRLPYTQGLLIASGYGLRLSDRYQHDIPPFRDAHQTALFLSGLIATDAIKPAVFPARPAAHLFEVGRDGAIDLSDKSAAAKFPTEETMPRNDENDGGTWLYPSRHTLTDRTTFSNSASPSSRWLC